MRLPRWLRRRRPEPVAYVDDGTLRVVGGSDDPAAADSAVVAAMEGAGVDLSRPCLVRHHLVLPDEAAVEAARGLLAPDGYSLVAEPVDGAALAAVPVRARAAAPAGAAWAVRASRTQVLTGLSAAQERSRMAGLAQRLGGDVRGWDACLPDPAAGTPDDDGRGRGARRAGSGSGTTPR